MTLIVGIIIGLALGLLGGLLYVKVGKYAALALAVGVVIATAIVWAQTDVNVGLLALLMVVYSATVLGMRALLHDRIV